MISQKNTFDRRAFINKSVYRSLVCLVASSFKIPAAAAARINDLNCRVPTLRGNISCNDLGTTLLHEHILLGGIPKELQKQTIDIAVQMLNEAATAGLKTLVDVMPFDSYCNSGDCNSLDEYDFKLKLYQEIAAQTPVNVIISTGFYRYKKAPAVLQNMTESQMEERMHHAVTVGVGKSKVRAGIIKLAADNSTLTDWEKKVFRAAARVQRSTGVPIGTHASQGACEQFDLLVANGANPNHLNFAHIETESSWKGRTREKMAEVLLHVPEGGGYLLFNNFSCEFYTPWKDMVYMMRYYCDKGYANRILISNDTNWEWKNGKPLFEKADEYPDAAKRTYGYLLTHDVPLMTDAGFSKEELDTFLIYNPRSFFSSW